MTLIRFGLTIAAAVLASTAAAQQPAAKPQQEPPSGKIGFVDSQRVMREAKTTIRQKQALDDKFEKAVKEIEAGPPERYEQRRIALDEDMGVEREDALRQFVDRTNRIIRRIAMEENLDVVFLEAAYFSQLVDLTEKVIKALDAEP